MKKTLKVFFKPKHTLWEKSPLTQPRFSQLTFPRIRGRGVLLAGGGGIMTTGGASVKVLLEEPQGHPCWFSLDRHHGRPQCCLSCRSLTISARPRSCCLGCRHYRQSGCSGLEVSLSDSSIIGSSCYRSVCSFVLSPGLRKSLVLSFSLSVREPVFILVLHDHAYC